LRSEIALDAQEAIEAASRGTIDAPDGSRVVVIAAEVRKIADLRLEMQARHQLVVDVGNRREILPVIVGNLDVELCLRRELPAAAAP